MPRPDQLYATAVRPVVGALRNLPWGYKAIWREMLMLDQGPDGCFLDTGTIAFRTGLVTGSVKKYRQTLQSLGMLVAENRREGRKWKWHWYPTLPRECIPPRCKLTDDEVAVWRDRLEQHIDSVKGNHSTPSLKVKVPDRGRTVVPLQDTVAEVMRGKRRTPSQMFEGVSQSR